MQVAAETCFFRSVEPLPDYKLLVETLPGERIVFDFAPRLRTTRYGDLRNADLFNSVTTDGVNLIFQTPGIMPVRVSAGEFFQLLARNPNKNQPEIMKEESR